MGGNVWETSMVYILVRVGFKRRIRNFQREVVHPQSVSEPTDKLTHSRTQPQFGPTNKLSL